MDWKNVQIWVGLGAVVLVWAFSAGVIWTRLNHRIDTNAKESNDGVTSAKKEASDAVANAHRAANDRIEDVRAEAQSKRDILEQNINGLGGRLQRQESACSNLDGRMGSAERRVDVIQQQGADVQSRLGKVEAGIEGVNNHVTEFKLELFQKLSDMTTTIQLQQSETRQMINDRDANLRERVARVEQTKGIPHQDR